MNQYEILRGDCITQMRAMPDNSVDSIVTDPPYELTSARPGGRSPATEGAVMKGFMGMAWDGSGIAFSVDMWAEALRVLKPGGHLLAFSGSRTYHRMTCAIEDAGFEVRDQIMWVYGSGFPKSLDVSKAIDKAAGHERGTNPDLRNGPNTKQETKGAGKLEGYTNQGVKEIDQGAVTDAARQWEGWGTALKPAHEPICVARKPLVGTVAANVLAHGTGALNIDGCRVPTNGEKTGGSGAAKAGTAAFGDFAGNGGNETSALGRWPANLIHDGSDEVVALFPDQQSGARAAGVRTGMGFHGADGDGGPAIQASTGSAARFFYCAKASKADRGPGNTHPTVKPQALMRYLVRLVTPPGGRVLDPFMGSGSTVVAALSEGMRATGIELLDEHAAIAEARIDRELYGDLL